MKLKFILISIVYVFALAFSPVQAQITNAWTSIQPTEQIPTGATIPTISKLTNPVKAYFTVKLDGTTYDNAVSVTGFAAVGAAVKTAIDSTYVEDVFGLDPSLDIVMRTYITSITRRFDNFEPTDLKNMYKAATNQYWVSGYCEWVITP